MIDSLAEEILEDLTGEVLVEQGKTLSEYALERMREQRAAEDIGEELIAEVQAEMAKDVAQEAIK